jgi:hypothetical protein
VGDSKAFFGVKKDTVFANIGDIGILFWRCSIISSPTERVST